MSFIPSPSELKDLRRKAGLTQKELAKRAGVSQSLIARIEKGTVNPRISTLRRIMKVIEEELGGKVRAKHIMRRDVIVACPNTKIEEVAKVMWEKGISQLPVVDEKGYPIGSIREDNIVKALLLYKERERVLGMKVSELMEGPLPTVAPDDSAERVIRILMEGFPAVLVTEGGKVVGIITKSDIIACRLLRIAHLSEAGKGSTLRKSSTKGL